MPSAERPMELWNACTAALVRGPNLPSGASSRVGRARISLVAAILAAYGHGSGHVFNLGHGITPGVNPDHVTAFVDAVQELSPRYHEDLEAR